MEYYIKTFGEFVNESKIEFDSNADFFIRWSEYIKSDIKRNWSCWNFGADGDKATLEKELQWIEEAMEKARNDGEPAEFDISGLELYFNGDEEVEVINNKIYVGDSIIIGELYKDYWVLIDQNYLNSLAGHKYIDKKDSLEAIIETVKLKHGRYDGTGEGEPFDANDYDLIYSSTIEGDFGFHIFQEK